MKKRLFPLLIAFSALAVSGSAAFYSVFGLSKLFAGASTQVIIMAGSLEFAKLVVASLLYQYWDTINKWLRSYLAIACFVLMIITSGGIYGFLSGAYQSTATKSELLDKSLAILEQKQVRFEETKEDLTLEKTQINKSIADLRISLSSPTSVSYWDKNSETVITTTSSSARRALQAELKTTIADRDKINLKLEAALDSIGKTDIALLNKEISNEDKRELGPLKYLAKTTGWPMDKVVNYFLLLIVFVFDPLAIALVVAANMAFAQIRPKVKMSVPEGKEFNTPYPMYSSSQEPNELLIKKVEEKKTHINTYGDDDWATPPEEEITLDGGEIEVTVEPTKKQMEEVDAFEKLKTRVKENQDKLKTDTPPFKNEPMEEEIWLPEPQLEDEEIMEDEKRMDIIGQNGNDGLHYEKEIKPELPIENDEKDIIVNEDEEVRSLTAKEVIKIKQQQKLAKQRLVYRNNRLI